MGYWIESKRRDVTVWEGVDRTVAAREFVAGKRVLLAEPDEIAQDHDERRGPEGRRLCYWCRIEIPKGRRNWCGDACVADYRLHHDWGVIRAAVWDRDRGVCAGCGVDSVEANLWWRRILRRMHRYGPAWNPLSKLLVKLTGWPINYMSRDWWEADHVVARRDGGEDHPRNLRTLCVPCHKDRTREQRKGWAA